MTRRAGGCRVAAAAAVVVALMAVPAVPASAGVWKAGVAAGSKGKARADFLTAPTGVVASCVSPTGTSVKVTWTAATGRAPGYTVLQATDSTPYTAVATVTGTSWTSGSLTNGFNYYYEITTTAGSKWTSAPTDPTPRRYVAGGACS